MLSLEHSDNDLMTIRLSLTDSSKDLIGIMLSSVDNCDTSAIKMMHYTEFKWQFIEIEEVYL